MWPALSVNVLAVGGTTLNTTGSARAYGSETAWSDSGGGPSLYEGEPNYRRSVQSSGKRKAPDVSYDANPNTGFSVYDSTAYNGQSGWFEVGGTSVAPQWSALIAIADQGRTLAKLSDLNGVNNAIYALPSTDFHDITSGSNGHAATPGYDMVTGRRVTHRESCDRRLGRRHDDHDHDSRRHHDHHYDHRFRPLGSHRQRRWHAGGRTR